MGSWYPKWNLNPLKFAGTNDRFKINDKKQTTSGNKKKLSTNTTPKDHKKSGGSHKTSSHRHGSNHEPSHSSSHRHHGSSHGRSSHSYGHENNHRHSHGHGRHSYSSRHGHNLGSTSNYTIVRTSGGGSGKICGDSKCGVSFICTADYNSRIQSMGYPGVTLQPPQTGSWGYGYHGR